MLGEELKRRREELGISLVEISEATRIGTRFLKAIETDNFAALPGGIFTRSFIRAYAKEVGMDADYAIALYQEQSGAADHPASDPPQAEADGGPFVYHEPSHTFWPSVLLATVAALILGTGGWAIKHYMSRPPEPEVAVATPDQQSPPPVAIQTSTPTQTDGLTLTLQATGPCWIRYSIDDGQPTQLVLQQGDTRDIAASEQIDLSIGNTQALSLRINNRDAQFPENTPIVLKKLTITPETASTFLVTHDR